MPKDRAGPAPGEGAKPPSDKRAVVSQSEMPSFTLERVLPIAQTIWDNFAGHSAPPQEIAVAIGVSPSSSAWRVMAGASIGYGVTEGGYNSKEIRLTELGRRIVAPQEEGQSEAAKAEAAKRPTILKKFYERYDRKKLPSREIGANVLVGMGLPKDRAPQDFDTLVKNAKFAGLMLETKTGPMVVSQPHGRIVAPTLETDAEDEVEGETALPLVAQLAPSRPSPIPSNKVFISHGSDRQIVEQLKKAIKIARLEHVVSVERETTAKPVPDKVFDDMRSCFAGIIHVAIEGKWKDESDGGVVRINENVLIEIGAAIALYRKNVILLVDSAVTLPSNLQGLYRCEYEGKELSANAFIKLLEAITTFEPGPSA